MSEEEKVVNNDDTGRYDDEDVHGIAVELSKFLSSIYDTISLPTSKTLARTLVVSGVVLIITTLTKLLGLFTLLDPMGALLCFIELLALSLSERSVKDELSGMYSAVELSVRKALCRTKTTGSGKSPRRNTNDNRRGKQKAGK